MGRVITLVLAAALARLLLPTAAGAAQEVVYRAPVSGPVIDPYRPPSDPYGPGNRGIDFATTPGEPVGAAADGLVTFAGAVGGGLHVVVLHADGIRTSLSFLAQVLVRRGQRVVVGQPVGRAGAVLHLGARRGEAYLDPASLLGRLPAGRRALLVPDGPVAPLDPQAEAAGLRRSLAGGRAPVLPAVPAARTSGPPPGARAAAVGGPPALAALALAAAAGSRRRRLRHGSSGREGAPPAGNQA